MDAIMTLDQQAIDFLKWIGVGVGWIISTYVTYRIARRSKHDDIHIGKRHNYAEQISALLQKDFKNRQLLTAMYHTNFDHMGNLSEAMHALHKNENLYRDMRELITELPTDIEKLQELNQNAVLYLEESTTTAIEKYIAETRFLYSTDGIGYFDNYAEKFFLNLLDEERLTALTKEHKKAMKGLRRAVR
jgi:hypothetical protein